jgi:AcrR family transcriptional regulator
MFIKQGAQMVQRKEINKNTEQKIIEVATEIFALNGYDGASVREICKRADINISMISYYFGGKKGLYEKIVYGLTQKIITYMFESMGLGQVPPDFAKIPKSEKLKFMFKAIGLIIDYFYSEKISDACIMIFVREQITSGVPLNAMGYNVFRKLLASILGKDENDKEIIFRCITIISQVQSARVLKQFSLDVIGQKQYSQADTLQFKTIVISQIKAIFKDILGDEWSDPNEE